MKNRLLSDHLSQKLYHDYAAEMPIFDYHSHVSAKEIYEDRHPESIGRLWLMQDHYKWRLMRICGVDEYFITGGASDEEKFLRFSQVLPLCIGNPVYTWCHMELEKYFGITEELNGESAERIYSECNRRLECMSVRSIIRESKVAFIGTTDHPCDSLEHHRLLASQSDLGFTVRPTFRPDEYINIHKEGFGTAIQRLSLAVGEGIYGLDKLKLSLAQRMEYFASHGCISADHGCDRIVYREASESEIDKIFRRATCGERISESEAEAYMTHMICFCAQRYAELDWVMQIHYNCIRDPNTVGRERLGADSGFDMIRRYESSEQLSRLMDRIYREGAPRMILYSLDEGENAYLDTLVGSFARGEPYGRIMHGAAWWFNDTRCGMISHLQSLSERGALGNFIGMLTDSRSFLSYVRHDYFRRVLCSYLSGVVARGEYLGDIHALGLTVQNICYNNARRFFGGEDIK